MKNLELKQNKEGNGKVEAGSPRLNTPFLSVAIITFNEERIIEKTISAIHNWVDEIVVVDSFSTDKTISILEMFNVTLIQEKWRGYSTQKNIAISKCTGDWILVLDADELVTKPLKDEVLGVIKLPGKKAGFCIPRKFFIGKRWVKHGGYYPDYQLRLFKSNIDARFKDRAVHESIDLDEEKYKIAYLKNPVEHYAYKDLKEYQKALDKYAELASKEIKNKTFYLPWLRAAWAFLYRYFIRLGFLEGELGFNLCKAYAGYVYRKYELAKK